jgi:hypothetical protein
LFPNDLGNAIQVAGRVFKKWVWFWNPLPALLLANVIGIKARYYKPGFYIYSNDQTVLGGCIGNEKLSFPHIRSRCQCVSFTFWSPYQRQIRPPLALWHHRENTKMSCLKFIIFPLTGEEIMELLLSHQLLDRGMYCAGCFYL